METNGTAWRVRFSLADAEVRCGPGDTVLDAALQAGLPLSYWCRGATCGMCRATIVEGSVRQEAALILGDDERAAGVALLCVARPLSDLVVEA